MLHPYLPSLSVDWVPKEITIERRPIGDHQTWCCQSVVSRHCSLDGFSSMLIESGMTQRGPVSSVISVIVLDAWSRHLSSKTRIQQVLGSYVDDVGVVLNSLTHQLPSASAVFLLPLMQACASITPNASAPLMALQPLLLRRFFFKTWAAFQIQCLHLSRCVPWPECCLTSVGPCPCQNVVAELVSWLPCAGSKVPLALIQMFVLCLFCCSTLEKFSALLAHAAAIFSSLLFQARAVATCPSSAT